MRTGFNVGIVMCFLSFAAGSPLTVDSIAWLLLTARWVYGADRYLDGKTDDTPESLILALVAAVAILDAHGMAEWALAETMIVQTYDPIKRTIPLLKPVYVGASWACATCAVPALLGHTDIQSQTAIAMGLLTTAVSNHADIRDIDEDRVNGVCTIPVMFGPNVARAFSASLALGAAATHFCSTALMARNATRLISMHASTSASPRSSSYTKRLSRRMKSRTSSRVKSYGQSCTSRYTSASNCP